MEPQKELTKKENKDLQALVAYVENSMYKPYKNLSGGFVESKVIRMSHSRILVRVKWGVKNGVEDRSYTREVIIERKKPNMTLRSF